MKTFTALLSFAFTIPVFCLLANPISSQIVDLTYHKEVFGEPSFNQHGIAFVLRGSDWVAINRKSQYLYTAYNYDNGPDPIVEGLMRYIENGKVGFANEKGKIVIPAKYDFAGQFEKGKAVFCNGCEKRYMGENFYYDPKTGIWGSINKKGKKI